MFYYSFGGILFDLEIYRGKIDDLIISIVFIIVYSSLLLKKRKLTFFILYIFYVFIFCALNNYNPSYWLYLLIIWWPVVFFDRIKLTEKGRLIFVLTYTVFMIIYYVQGSLRTKYYNIDVNVLHMFMALVFIAMLSRRYLWTIPVISPALTIMNGTRSTILLISIFTRKYPLVFIAAVIIYMLLYSVVLSRVADNAANLARFHLLLNHFSNVMEASVLEQLFGSGPQAYLRSSLLIETDVTFVKSKPKTVDSSILRIFYEFGIIGGMLLFYSLFRLIGNFSKFILIVVAFGLSNEGLLSFFGPLSVLVVSHIKFGPTKILK